MRHTKGMKVRKIFHDEPQEATWLYIELTSPNQPVPKLSLIWQHNGHLDSMNESEAQWASTDNVEISIGSVV